MNGRTLIAILILLIILGSIGLLYSFLNKLAEESKAPCKCDCSYTVLDAEHIINAKGDTVKYPWNKHGRLQVDR